MYNIIKFLGPKKIFCIYIIPLNVIIHIKISKSLNSESNNVVDEMRVEMTSVVGNEIRLSDSSPNWEEDDSCNTVNK